MSMTEHHCTDTNIADVVKQHLRWMEKEGATVELNHPEDGQDRARHILLELSAGPKKASLLCLSRSTRLLLSRPGEGLYCVIWITDSIPNRAP